MFKPTHAQSAELHVLASGVLSLLSGVADAAYQSGVTNHLSAFQIIGFALGTLTVSLGASFISIMHAMMSSPQATQAEADTASQLTTWIDSRLTGIEQRVLSLVARTGSPTPMPVLPQQVSQPTPITFPTPAPVAPEPVATDATQASA